MRWLRQGEAGHDRAPEEADKIIKRTIEESAVEVEARKWRWRYIITDEEITGWAKDIPEVRWHWQAQGGEGNGGHFIR